VALGVKCGRTARAGGGDGLPVAGVHDVAAGEHARQAGRGGGVVDLDVAALVEVHLAGEHGGARVVADGDEHPGDVVELGEAAVDGVAQRDADELVGVVDAGGRDRASGAGPVLQGGGSRVMTGGVQGSVTGVLARLYEA